PLPDGRLASPAPHRLTCSRQAPGVVPPRDFCQADPMSLTHEVTNQVPPLAGYDAAADPALLDAVRREGAGWAEPALPDVGRQAGDRGAREWGRPANESPPRLRTHDRYGHRIDEVEFHPAWHDLMAAAVGHGLDAAPWQDARPGAHVARAAGFYLWGQAEAG